LIHLNMLGLFLSLKYLNNQRNLENLGISPSIIIIRVIIKDQLKSNIVFIKFIYTSSIRLETSSLSIDISFMPVTILSSSAIFRQIETCWLYEDLVLSIRSQNGHL